MISEEDRKRIEAEAVESTLYQHKTESWDIDMMRLFFKKGAIYELELSQSSESLLKEEIERLKAGWMGAEATCEKNRVKIQELEQQNRELREHIKSDQGIISDFSKNLEAVKSESELRQNIIDNQRRKLSIYYECFQKVLIHATLPMAIENEIKALLK